MLTGEHWTAFVPAAARWPVELHLAPHRDVPDFTALDDAERDELAHVYLELLRRVDRYFDGVEALPYIAAWHQAPVREHRELGRLHLELFSVLRGSGQAQVPGRVGVRDGRVDQRRRPREHRRAAAGGRVVTEAGPTRGRTGTPTPTTPPGRVPWIGPGRPSSRRTTGSRRACGRHRAAST